MANGNWAELASTPTWHRLYAWLAGSAILRDARLRAWLAAPLAALDRLAAWTARLTGGALLTDKAPKPEVARYASLDHMDSSILDTYIPRHKRLTQLHFGHIVTNPDVQQAFSENVGYNMTFNLVEPFKGNALHVHPSVEVFIALNGRWEIAWGATGAQTTVLEPFDLVAVPADVRHAYKNLDPHVARNIMTILPGKAAITWAPAVIAEARRHGALCTDDGTLVDFWKSTSPDSSMADLPSLPPAEAPAKPTAKATGKATAQADFHVEMSDAAMAACVRRFASRQPLRVSIADCHVSVSWRVLGTGDAVRAADVPSEDDVLIVVLEGSAELSDARDGSALAFATQLDAVRLAAGGRRAAALTNRCAQPCTLLVVASQMRPLVGRFASGWAIGDAR